MTKILMPKNYVIACKNSYFMTGKQKRLKVVVFTDVFDGRKLAMRRPFGSFFVCKVSRQGVIRSNMEEAAPDESTFKFQMGERGSWDNILGGQKEMRFATLPFWGDFMRLWQYCYATFYCEVALCWP